MSRSLRKIYNDSRSSPIGPQADLIVALLHRLFLNSWTVRMGLRLSQAVPQWGFLWDYQLVQLKAALVGRWVGPG